jgi:predicted kinase
VFDLPDSVVLERNQLHRRLATDVVARQAAELRASLGWLAQEGLARVHILNKEDAVAEAVVERRPDILILTP